MQPQVVTTHQPPTNPLFPALSYLLFGALTIWCLADLVVYFRRSYLLNKEVKPAPETHLEWIPGQGYKAFGYPFEHYDRSFLFQLGEADMFRNRKREQPARFDHQCMHCWKVYQGPDMGFDPDHEITVGPSGVPVSHGLCPECSKDVEDTLRSLYGEDYEQRAREAKERLDKEKDN